MIDTPRTDAYAATCSSVEKCDYDFMCQLERELAEARANASAYRVDYLMAKDRLAKAEAELWRHEIKVTVLDGIGLEALKAENAALKARIDQLVEYVGTSASPELLKAVIFRAERAEAEVAALKEKLRIALVALEGWDALIEHQYSGTRAAMDALQRACDRGCAAISAAKEGKA